MNIETFRSHCISKKGVTEEFPFGDTTLVYKVMGKIFALTGIENFTSVNLKVDPEISVELQERYTSIKPGYHMNKKHWITVLIDGTIPDKMILEWLDNSYQLVAASLTKSQKTLLESL